MVPGVNQLNANDRKPCSLNVYHEINCRISVEKPAHLFIKVISNTMASSQTQDKITCNSAITEEEKNISSVHLVSVMIGGDI